MKGNTKVKIIGEDAVTVKKYTKIKFTDALSGIGVIEAIVSSYKDLPDEARIEEWPLPRQWENVELIAREYTVSIDKSRKDLMFAYDKDRTNGILYLGYFNEGIV